MAGGAEATIGKKGLDTGKKGLDTITPVPNLGKKWCGKKRCGEVTVTDTPPVLATEILGVVRTTTVLGEAMTTLLRGAITTTPPRPPANAELGMRMSPTAARTRRGRAGFMASSYRRGAAVSSRVAVLDLPKLVAERRCGSDQLRLPGLMAALPVLQRGHSSGAQVVAWTVASATRFCANRTAPPERSISAPMPTTTPPAFSAHSTTSRVEPPVVMTSSTTRQRSPAERVKLRRSVIAPVSRSVKSARTPSARATSWATR